MSRSSAVLNGLQSIFNPPGSSPSSIFSSKSTPDPDPPSTGPSLTLDDLFSVPEPQWRRLPARAPPPSLPEPPDTEGVAQRLGALRVIGSDGDLPRAPAAPVNPRTGRKEKPLPRRTNVIPVAQAPCFVVAPQAHPDRPSGSALAQPPSTPAARRKMAPLPRRGPQRRILSPMPQTRSSSSDSSASADSDVSFACSCDSSAPSSVCPLQTASSPVVSVCHSLFHSAPSPQPSPAPHAPCRTTS